VDLNRNYKNTRKFDIEQAKANDGTYQALLLFARNTKVIVIQQPKALKQKYMWLEYEDNGKPSGIADQRVEFFAINFDLKDRIYFIRAEMLRIKARRYFKWGKTKIVESIRYVKVPTQEIIRFD
jgi:hypothetical protein